MTVACESCRFWQRVQADDGLCRRNAPFPEPASHEAFWPITLDQDWCGDFQPQPVQQKVEAPDALARPAP